MELKDYYHLVLRNLLLISSCVALGLITSSAITFTATPIYQAEVQLFVSTPSSSLDIAALAQGSSFSQQRVKSYAQIVNSPETLKPVISELKLDISPESLAKRVKASAPLDTVLINVTVSDEKPQRVAAIANLIGKQFAITANNLEVSSNRANDAVKVSVVKLAVAPDFPSSPKKSLNLALGLLLGLGLGIGLSILRSIFDNTVKNDGNLDGTPLLATIGFDEEAATKPLLTDISRYSSRTESMRHLRTNLLYANADNPPRKIFVTSALPAEGKTLTSINLASSFALAGFKTLLIEGDLRRPKIPKYLAMTTKSDGLSELLSGRIKWQEDKSLLQSVVSIQQESELAVLTAGTIPPNPSELLDSNTFTNLLAEFSHTYDFIIIDCPPLLPVSDAAIIATRCDGGIVITRAGHTKIAQFIGTRENIESVGGKLLGAVINMVPVRDRGQEYGYRYSGYGKYNEYSTYEPSSSKSSKE